MKEKVVQVMSCALNLKKKKHQTVAFRSTVRDKEKHTGILNHRQLSCNFPCI